MRTQPFGFGVFLPMGNGGWLISKNAPEVDGSYDLNRRVAKLSEQMGLDYAIAMAKWRGYGGTTDYWEKTLDSFAMCCGIAEVTNRIDLYCTVHTTVFHPVAIAKMMATFDHISGGRAGMNIVAKSYNPESGQMGLPRIDESLRYTHAREWLTVIKRLWAEDHVNLDGQFFQIDDCMSNPKPLRKPRPPLVCAGISDIGRVFTIEEADACLISGTNHEELKVRSKHVKELARELGRPTNTLALIMVVPGKTHEDAVARVDLFNRGIDLNAMDAIAGANANARMGGRQMTNIALMAGYQMPGSAETLVDQLTDWFENGELDGVVLTVPDFIDDLEWFGERVLPVMQRRGFTRELAGAALAG